MELTSNFRRDFGCRSIYRTSPRFVTLKILMRKSTPFGPSSARASSSNRPAGLLKHTPVNRPHWYWPPVKELRIRRDAGLMGV